MLASSHGRLAAFTSLDSRLPNLGTETLYDVPSLIDYCAVGVTVSSRDRMPVGYTVMQQWRKSSSYSLR